MTPNSLSQAEENYLKAIFKLSPVDDQPVSNNAVSTEMKTSAASVTDMIGRLSKKELIHYQKHRGVKLSKSGIVVATHLVRKHRLWETFLFEKLNFSWDEVHELAEQLEHIKSTELVNRLDDFLGNPKFDPHGDPIPDANGRFSTRQQVPLSQLLQHEKAVIVGVKDHTTPFLKYLEQTGLVLGVSLQVADIFEYDGSLQIILEKDKTMVISQKVSQNLFVQKT